MRKALAQMPWYLRIVFWLQLKHYGQVLDSALYWAKSPRVFLALSWLFRSLDRKKSPLSPELRSLIILAVSQLNACAFCQDLNQAIAVKRGMTQEKMQALAAWKSSKCFNAKEQLILAYVEAVTLGTGDLDAKLQAQMQQHYTLEQRVEITALIAFQNMSTKFNNAFAIQAQGFCQLEGQSKSGAK